MHLHYHYEHEHDCLTWHLHWFRLLGPSCHRHVHVRQVVLAVLKSFQIVFNETFNLSSRKIVFFSEPLPHVLKCSEGELGTHPQSSCRPDVGHNFNLGCVSCDKPQKKIAPQINCDDDDKICDLA